MKNWQAAKDDATKCISKDPSFIKGYYRLSVAHTEMGEYDQANNILKEAIRRDPGMSFKSLVYRLVNFLCCRKRSAAEANENSSCQESCFQRAGDSRKDFG
jgi:tetratricopeptide (TPR) repeat protein